MTNKKLTNRQAIGVLDGLWSNPLFGEAHRQAFEIGIKAIKAIEQEPCEDAISRSDMLDAIGHGTTYTSEELQRIIKGLPPVNPQPQKGHWTRELIRNEKGGCIGAKMICSECGNDNRHDEYMNYCPNCGAKMVEPQERSDKE